MSEQPLFGPVAAGRGAPSRGGADAQTSEARIRDPEAFWGEAATAVTWIRRPRRVLDASGAPFYRWFPDATLNTCFNALDRHVVNGCADQAALVYDSPVAGTRQAFTYAHLLEQVAAFAGALRQLGVDRGDGVVICMPMVPEAVIAMLACARLGAVHSVVSGGCAPAELAVRLDDARPTVVVSASCGIEPTGVVPYKPALDRAIELAKHIPGSVVVLQRPQVTATLVKGRDVAFDVAMRAGATDPAECVEVAATDPLYVLHSGGHPQGVVCDNGASTVALSWSMGALYDLRPGQVWWTAADVGEAIGHSYIVYAPLFAGATTVLYEGKPVGTPDAGAFWRVVAEHRVEALLTAPTAIRAIRTEDPEARMLSGHDVSSLRALFLAGDRFDPDTFEWASARLGVPIVDHWWQTGAGWPVG